MEKALYLLVACLCILLQEEAIPQARHEKHSRLRIQHKKHSEQNRNSKSFRYTARKTAGSTRMSKVRYGIASFYNNKFTGRKTASGEKYSPKKLTAACNVIPLGTILRVTNLSNNRSVIVKVNDRLHHSNRRLLDLSKASAMELRIMPHGTVRVKIVVIRDNKTKHQKKMNIISVFEP